MRTSTGQLLIVPEAQLQDEKWQNQSLLRPKPQERISLLSGTAFSQVSPTLPSTQTCRRTVIWLEMTGDARAIGPPPQAVHPTGSSPARSAPGVPHQGRPHGSSVTWQDGREQPGRVEPRGPSPTCRRVLLSPTPDHQQTGFPQHGLVPGCTASPPVGGAPNPRAARLKADTPPCPGEEGARLKMGAPHLSCSSRRDSGRMPRRTRAAAGLVGRESDGLSLRPLALTMRS